MKLRVVLEPTEEGGYPAIVPALPGCISEGGTRDEPLINIEEAIRLYLEPGNGSQQIESHQDRVQ
jgi:predicted RNase H-like HicB family nuclease